MVGNYNANFAIFRHASTKIRNFHWERGGCAERLNVTPHNSFGKFFWTKNRKNCSKIFRNEKNALQPPMGSSAFDVFLYFIVVISIGTIHTTAHNDHIKVTFLRYIFLYFSSILCSPINVQILIYRAGERLQANGDCEFCAYISNVGG